jgi:hypothetical protein
MNYTELHNELKSVFDPSKPEILLPGGITIKNIPFHSGNPDECFINPADPGIPENKSFSYPVFIPGENVNRAILMLHGLNERSWTKYLSWAYRLAESTSSYVILFPISFHINRSPETWSNPRSMSAILNSRNSLIGNISNSSFANVALSDRLTSDPMRFFYSGYQTSNDIISLLNSVRNGTHPVIPGKCTINIFAYSIGAFLSEILMMGNPENLYSDSRLFIFCGGSVFSNMNGSSKLIMDRRAFDRIYRYYLYDFEERSKGNNRLSQFLYTNPVGLAFRSMIDIARLLPFREKLLAGLKEQICVIGLEKDSVIPAAGIIETLKATRKKRTVSILDFAYPYSHENPFPVFNTALKGEVDRSFDLVFNEASSFLA